MKDNKNKEKYKDCCYRAMGYCTSFENCPYRVNGYCTF